VKRFAELGVIANCTPLWGTDYDGTFYDTYLAKLGAERMEERLYPYGDLVRSGALVTYGSDIPGVRISEIAPLTQIEAAVRPTRTKTCTFADTAEPIDETTADNAAKVALAAARAGALSSAPA
jgi:predicted amidohydrolase YtcJ